MRSVRPSHVHTHVRTQASVQTPFDAMLHKYRQSVVSVELGERPSLAAVITEATKRVRGRRGMPGPVGIAEVALSAADAEPFVDEWP